jgi:carbon-monoxide dehydrogenase medium subunit
VVFASEAIACWFLIAEQLTTGRRSMSIWNQYIIPKSLSDALQALTASQGEVRLIAGGTDLLLDLQQGRQKSVDTLIDVSRIPELTCLELRADHLFLGAGVPLDEIIASPLIHRHAPAVYEACSLIGGPQVRNTATLGGNVAHALPAGDGSIALLALGAITEIATPEGLRNLPIEELFLAPGKSALEGKTEIIVGFYLPLSQNGQTSVFKRVMRPQGVALPILNMAIWLLRENNTIADIRIAIGPAGPKPFRARITEDELRGRIFDTRALDMAKKSLCSETRFRTSPHRASSTYRSVLSQSLLEDCLNTAWERAQSK